MNDGLCSARRAGLFTIILPSLKEPPDVALKAMREAYNSADKEEPTINNSVGSSDPIGGSSWQR